MMKPVRARVAWCLGLLLVAHGCGETSSNGPTGTGAGGTPSVGGSAGTGEGTGGGSGSAGTGVGGTGNNAGSAGSSSGGSGMGGMAGTIVMRDGGNVGPACAPSPNQQPTAMLASLGDNSLLDLGAFTCTTP